MKPAREVESDGGVPKFELVENGFLVPVTAVVLRCHWIRYVRCFVRRARGAPGTRWGGRAAAGPVWAGSPPIQSRKNFCTCVTGLAEATLSASPTLGNKRPHRAAFASSNPVSVLVLALIVVGAKIQNRGGGVSRPSRGPRLPRQEASLLGGSGKHPDLCVCLSCHVV